MKKNNVFVAPAEDLYLTTELDRASCLRSLRRRLASPTHPLSRTCFCWAHSLPRVSPCRMCGFCMENRSTVTTRTWCHSSWLRPRPAKGCWTTCTDSLCPFRTNWICREKLNDEFTTQEAYDVGDSLEMGNSTVMDHLTFCRKNKLIERLARGRYRKL